MGASVWNPGGAVINVDGENASLIQKFVATLAQTTFTLSAFTYAPGTGGIRVYRNGVKLEQSVVIEVSSTQFQLSGIPAVAAGEIIECAAVAITDASFGIVNGNLTFVGATPRITGDLSSATQSNRLLFQSSTVNGQTNLGVIPNGTSQLSTLTAFNNQDASNASTAYLQVSGSQVVLGAGKTGTGSYKPLVLNVGGVDTFTLDTSGNSLHVNPAGGLGYGAGAGGSVTQTTSRTTTTPAINKPNGDIVLFTAAGSATPASFSVANTLVGLYDVPVIAVRGATNKYLTQITNVVAGVSFEITFWTTGGTASDTPVFHFNLSKGSIT